MHTKEDATKAFVGRSHGESIRERQELESKQKDTHKRRHAHAGAKARTARRMHKTQRLEA